MLFYLEQQSANYFDERIAEYPGFRESEDFVVTGSQQSQSTELGDSMKYATELKLLE